MQAANRAILNTAIIYAKTVVTIIISLFSTRLIMNALGTEDFGLFNVIGGLISMLSFLNAAMTVSTQRYISYNLGLGNVDKIKSIFASSIILHLFIAVALTIVFEVAGLYLLNYQLKIDYSRLDTANTVFQFVVVSTFITIISVPYDALLNANENMAFLALTGILESLLKITIAYYLYFSGGDKLFTYGLLTMLSAIVIRLIKQIYVRRKYSESRVTLLNGRNNLQITELMSFAGWNLFGSLSFIARNQGLSVLLNLFYGTAINAAFGIANQVAGQLVFFSSAMLQAVNPQIMKAAGAGDNERMIDLSLTASKLGFILLAFIAIPSISELPEILTLWLKIVPQYSVDFCSLILLSIMVNQLTIGLDSAIQATGKIRNYMTIGGTIKILLLPFSYILLKLNLDVVYVFVSYLAFEILGGLVRVFIVHKEASLSLKKYLDKVIKPIVPVVFFTILFNVMSNRYINLSHRWLITIPVSIILFVALTYVFSLSPDEKGILKKMWFTIKSKINSLRNKSYVNGSI